MSEVLCGIDLGTTNSCIAYLKNGVPVVIPVDDGHGIVPSVVSIDGSTGEVIVGRRAKNRLAAFPEHSIKSIKRLMGSDQKVTLGSRTYSPQEVSSFILKFLSNRASEMLSTNIKKVVITVPAYFNDAQRRATIEAGQMAGLEVLRIINEPTAASLVYDHTDQDRPRSDNPYILVYDLGGGTFDVSILKVSGEIKEVLASTGDTALGGDDFDERIVQHLLEHVRTDNGIDIQRVDRSLHIRLLEIAERAKIHLSANPYVNIKEIGLKTANGETINIDLELSRQEYEDLIKDLIDETIDKVKDALNEANLSTNDIGKIILVGGATKTPIIQERLSELFKKDILHTVDPDLCVALGASVQCGLICGEPLGHILIDVTAHSLGVKTADWFNDNGEADYFSPIIKRNTTVPVKKAKVFYTMVDNQKVVDVEVYQGESHLCSKNTLVGDFHFKLKPAPSGSPIVVDFAYDSEGIVHVTVDQKGYNNKKEVTLYVREEGKRDDDTEDRVVNYIVEKAKRLIDNSLLSESLRAQLSDLCDRYSKALNSEIGEDEIDEIEAQLLEKIEEAEEILGT